MAYHARVEELSDTDSDPEVMDPSDLNSSSIIRPAHQSPHQSSNSALFSGHNIPASSSQAASQQIVQAKPDHTWCTLYPLYFDSAASRAEGRRVGKEDATANPLAKSICDALVNLGGAKIGFEPGKRHPKDWANPGRVRVKVWDEGGKWMLRDVKNKRDLFRFIANYLKSHPTTTSDPFKLPIRGMPMPNEEDVKPPPVPRGWRINDIIPLHSPAMSGGGVSDNIMKDIQAVMRGEEPGGPSSGGQVIKPDKKKKDKKKK